MYYLTDDTALAQYLYLRGVGILEGTIHNPNHNRRRFFVFEQHDEIPALREEFYNRTSVVVPLDYQEARTYISRFLKIDLSNPERYLNGTIKL